MTVSRDLALRRASAWDEYADAWERRVGEMMDLGMADAAAVSLLAAIDCREWADEWRRLAEPPT